MCVCVCGGGGRLYGHDADKNLRMRDVTMMPMMVEVMAGRRDRFNQAVLTQARWLVEC